MADCCGIEVKNKNGFFNSTKWKIIVLIVGVALCVLSFFWHDIIGHDSKSFFLYLDPAWIVIFVCGWPLAYGGFVNLFKYKKVKTSLLITVAMLACIALEILTWFGIASSASHGHGNLFAAGEVALLMWLGEFLEDITVKRSRKGVEALVKLNSTTANIKMGDQYVEMDAEFVNVGDTVLVKPNQLIPVDGEVKSGVTSVSQAAITGESVPIDKTVGDMVFAGTFNQNGAIEITVTKASADSTLSKMIKLVKEAESKKAPIERTADKWARVIVPSAIVLSVVVFLVRFFCFDKSWQESLTSGVTVLVVFCPCSLALATPTAIAAGIGNASYRGVIIKSGSALESMAKMQVAVFDKTGTLTKNQLSVMDYMTTVEEQKDFFNVLGSVEKNSEHPLSKAIVSFCQSKTQLSNATNTTSMVGVGVSADVEGKKVVAAKVDFFTDMSKKLSDYAKQMMQKGLTVIGVSIDDKAVGVVGISDVIKEEAIEVVSQLKSLNIKSIMLTGDNQLSATQVGSTVGIDEECHGLLPSDKVNKIAELKQAGKNVCMVGDGVNDAPSLATATTGIAMGAFGSDAALEVADVVLMNDDLQKVSGLVRLSKRVLTTIKTNIIIGMVVNLGAVILSALGLLNPALGALVHNASSVFVVGNSALILGAKKPFDAQNTTQKCKKSN